MSDEKRDGWVMLSGGHWKRRAGAFDLWAWKDVTVHAFAWKVTLAGDFAEEVSIGDGESIEDAMRCAERAALEDALSVVSRLGGRTAEQERAAIVADLLKHEWQPCGFGAARIKQGEHLEE